MARHSYIPQIFLLVMVLLVACARPAEVPTATPGSSPHDLVEPFLSAWSRAGGEAALGPPLSHPLWIDDAQVQLFERFKISAVDGSQAVVDPLPADWRARYPADLLQLTPAALHASIALADGQGPVAQPLEPTTATISIIGYSGPVELRLYDADLRPSGQLSMSIVDGSAQAELLPRGRLGPQWAIVLVDGELAGARSKLFELDATTGLQTGQADLDALYPRISAFMARDVVSYQLNGRTVRGYRSPDNPLLWLRDHVYQGQGFRYFEQDVTSLLDAFRDAQRPDGSFPDAIDYPGLSVSAFRKEVEADLEFLYVQGVYEAWQMSGDDEWLRANIEPMRRALSYIMSNPLRWNAERGLVRRPYTIDMWDFAYGPSVRSPDGQPAPRHWITSDTIWGTFHGDNTGLAYALNLMASIERRVGDPDKAADWQARAEAIMGRLNKLSWNGRFFTHFVPEDPAFQPKGVDPAEQLSLSNAFALNRHVLDDRQGQAIIEEYFSRRDFSRAFADWYSIDPPFPAGSYGMGGGKGEQPGEYVNGGIMPLVGGELARGAFRYGLESYGFDILRRYAALTELTGASYLWYYPDGRAGISGADTLDSDGWGASAMLGALLEGAAGISDNSSRFRDIRVIPRWTADPNFKTVRVVARYAASDGYVAYNWRRGERRIDLSLASSAESSYVRILLPRDAPADDLRVSVDGAPAPTQIDLVGASAYATVTLSGGDAEISVAW